MNRIQLGELKKTKPAAPPNQVDQSFVEISSSPAGTDHSVFVPLHYEKNYAYPLLIWMHGGDDDERQLQRIMPLVSMRNYVAIAPRGVVHGQRGFCWDQSQRSIDAGVQSVFDCLEVARRRFNIAPGRVFIGGYSCGGTMAFRIAANHPAEFAGVLSIGGAFPQRHTPLANLEQLRRLPLFIASGRDAIDYPAAAACDQLRLFHVAGLSVTLRQYPCGDELTTQMLHDMDVWIMEQVTGAESTSPAIAQFRPEQAN